MIITTRHYINELDLAKAVQALYQGQSRITKSSIVRMARDVVWLHGEGAQEREFLDDPEVISPEEALKIVRKYFPK